MGREEATRGNTSTKREGEAGEMMERMTGVAIAALPA